MKLFLQLLLSIALFFVISKGPLYAVAQQAVSFPQGANSLFIGHSFFCPIADQFGEFAAASGQFPNHNLTTFKRGGELGSPINLWVNHKAEIEAIFNSSSLAGTPIEIFGMTAGAPSDQVQPIEDIMLAYTQWIDLAIGYNPSTSIYIGNPWQDFPTNYTNATVYEAKIEETAELVYTQLIMELRATYPANNIFFLSYGSVTTAMRHLYEDGELEGINYFTKPPTGATRAESLFVDTKGHAGTMLMHLAGMTYLNWFYGVPMMPLVNAADTLLPWDRQNVIDILTAAGVANEEYRLYE